MKWSIIGLLISFVGYAAYAEEQRGLTITTITDQQGQSVGLYTESHALLIGVSEYTAGWPKLPGVKEDIQAIQAILEHHGFATVIVNDPTHEQLQAAFTDFINQYGRDPDNRLLFYFAGHGHTLKQSYGEEMGYVVPTDAPNPHQNADGFFVTAMDMQQIEVYAKRIQAKHALFIFDSCFSGSIFALSRAIPENISYKTAKPVRQFITSGSADEQVPDVSIFRQQFVAALTGEGDVDQDGYITATELGEFLQGNVVNYSKGSQHPQYGKIRHPQLDKGDFVFQLPEQRAALEGKDTSLPPSSVSIDAEEEFWKMIRESQDTDDFKAYLQEYPEGRFAALARLKLKRMEEASQDAEQQTVPQAQLVKWGPPDGWDAGICVGKCEEFIPWGQVKQELLAQLLPQVPEIPSGTTFHVTDMGKRKNWIVQILNPAGKEIGNVWFGFNPLDNWNYDGLVRVGTPKPPVKIWAIFQRYSDGSYQKR